MFIPELSKKELDSLRNLVRLHFGEEWIEEELLERGLALKKIMYISTNNKFQSYE
jgi:hypothetical protein